MYLLKYNYQIFKEKCFDIIGHTCVKCGCIDRIEIDHIDWQLKSFSISKKSSPKYWNDVVEELKKCQPLCFDCHLEKSRIDLSEQNKKDRSLLHGTLSQYFRYKCRCVLCLTSYKEWRRSTRLKSGETKGIREPYKKAVCGTNSMYHNGCRCNLCKIAHTENARKYRKIKI